MKMAKNSFLPFLAIFATFFLVGYREEGTTRATLLSNDTIIRILGQLVDVIEKSQTDVRKDGQTILGDF